jgi:geranylgeranyl diphosphate synthase type I
LDPLTATLRDAIENDLKQVIARSNGPGLEEFRAMLAYHLGWEGQGAGRAAQGKRIRPLLVLLVTSAAGGDWQHALPAASAVELVHNFSLIHDDIEDNSPIRRGRLTVWKIWGVPQAINAGDAMVTAAQLALLGLEKTTSSEIALKASRILQETCLQLTQGQYLDIAYENRKDLSLESYWQMVGGKTAALLSACTQLGALIAGADDDRLHAYRKFGRFLGLAFQAQDDLLGMWGDEALTGKSTESDLVTGKKSLPVLYGLNQGGAFARRWTQGPVRNEEVPTLAAQLSSEGAQDYTQEQANRLTTQALDALELAEPQGKAGELLREMANQLLKRKL